MKAPFELVHETKGVVATAFIKDTLVHLGQERSKKEPDVLFECHDVRDDEDSVFGEIYGGKFRWGTGQFLKEREDALPEPIVHDKDPYFQLAQKARTSHFEEGFVVL